MNEIGKNVVENEYKFVNIVENGYNFVNIVENCCKFVKTLLKMNANL
jgi:hypothetical protein